jgi:hypothetical protein
MRRFAATTGFYTGVRIMQSARSVDSKKRKARLFERLGKEDALTGVRSMLNDPNLKYESIAQRLGITRQRVAQIAAEMGWTGGSASANARCVHH